MLVFLDENNTCMCAIFAQIIFINNICLFKRAVPSENVSLKHMQTIEIQLVCTSRSFGGASLSTYKIIGYCRIQSTLVISKSKGLYETLRDIRTSTYQICGTEENN